MKTLAGILTILILSLTGLQSEAQEHNTILKEKFKVYGSCGMCKTTIENACNSIEGVKAANWNTDSKMISVKFDSSKTNLETIKKAIAGVGYDTEEFRADDVIYNKLHGCCKYERPSTKND